MIEDLKLFFEDYPRQILQMKGVRPSDLPDGLMDRLLDYRHRQLVNLEDAQYFWIDTDTFWMISELINEMKRDGLEELFSKVMLPFPTMIIQVPVIGDDKLPFGVVMQVDDFIYTQQFILAPGGLSPSASIMVSQGMGATRVITPTRDLFVSIGLPTPDGLLEAELESNETFLGTAVAIATLLRHDGMLKVEDIPLYPRQQKRQAERSGKPLPDTRISKITLGKAGRGQVEAMKEDIATGGREGIPRRTHWVRGHTMRSRSGQIVWRMPHLRGAGPLIKQVRHVTSEIPAEVTKPSQTDREN